MSSNVGIRKHDRNDSVRDFAAPLTLNILIKRTQLQTFIADVLQWVAPHTASITVGTGLQNWLDWSQVENHARLTVYSAASTTSLPGTLTHVALSAQDALANEWFLLANDPGWCVLLVAQPDDEQIRFSMTFDPRVVGAVASRLRTDEVMVAPTLASDVANARLLQHLLALLPSPRSFMKLPPEVGIAMGLTWVFEQRSPEQRWPAALQAITSVIPASQATLYALEGDDNETFIAVWSSTDHYTDAYWPIMREAVERKRIIAQQDDEQSVMMLPITVERQLWGVLQITHAVKSRHVQRLQLASLSAVIGLAIERGELTIPDVPAHQLPPRPATPSAMPEEIITRDSEETREGQLDSLGDIDDWLANEYASVDANDVHWPELEEFQRATSEVDVPRPLLDDIIDEIAEELFDSEEAADIVVPSSDEDIAAFEFPDEDDPFLRETTDLPELDQIIDATDLDTPVDTSDADSEDIDDFVTAGTQWDSLVPLPDVDDYEFDLDDTFPPFPAADANLWNTSADLPEDDPLSRYSFGEPEPTFEEVPVQPNSFEQDSLLSRFQFEDDDLAFNTPLGRPDTSYVPDDDAYRPALLGAGTYDLPDEAEDVPEETFSFGSWSMQGRLEQAPEPPFDRGAFPSLDELERQGLFDLSHLTDFVADVPEDEAASVAGPVEPTADDETTVEERDEAPFEPVFPWQQATTAQEQATPTENNALSFDLDQLLRDLQVDEFTAEISTQGVVEEIDAGLQNLNDAVIDARLLDVDDLQKRPVAHEPQPVKTPPAILLRDLRLFLSRIRSRMQRILPPDGGQNRAQAHLANQILSETETTLEILNELTRNINLDQVERKRFDVTTVLKDVLRSRQKSFAEKGLTLDWEPTNDLAVIEGNRDVFTYGLTKLFDGLAAFIVQRGQVWVRLETNPDQATMTIRLIPVHMKPDQLERALRFFHDGVPEQSDLAIAQLVITQHSGTLHTQLQPKSDRLELSIQLELAR